MVPPGEEYQRGTVMKFGLDHFADENVVVANRDGAMDFALQCGSDVREEGHTGLSRMPENVGESIMAFAGEVVGDVSLAG